jgi:hypothetical protein
MTEAEQEQVLFFARVTALEVALYRSSGIPCPVAEKRAMDAAKAAKMITGD